MSLNLECNQIVSVNGIKYHITNKKDSIQRWLFHQIQWNGHIVDIIQQYQLNGKLKHFLNIGCHIGAVCLPLSSWFEKVTAIEAYKPTFEQFKKNIALNHI